ncbi:FtsQ-type POTRA domain-containing protein [bacterium]|nr:FtsQ-type POTRA domain-containing protein [bacterium]
MASDENNTSTESMQDLQNSVIHKQRERHIRKKRKKYKKTQTFFSFVLTFLLIFLSYKFFNLKQWYLPQDAFQNSNAGIVEVFNNKIIPTYVINQVIKDVPVSKLPIFLVSVKPIKKELYQIPVVDKVYIRRYGFPARIQIIVRERTPLAIIRDDLNSKPQAFFTSDGVVVTNKKYMNLAQTSQVLNILSKYSKDWNFEKVKEIEKIVKDVETYSNEKVEYVDMKNPNDVYVKIKTTSIRLGILDSTVFERIKRIYTILPQISGVDGQIKYIDLSWDKVNYLKMNK